MNKMLNNDKEPKTKRKYNSRKNKDELSKTEDIKNETDIKEVEKQVSSGNDIASETKEDTIEETKEDSGSSSRRTTKPKTIKTRSKARISAKKQVAPEKKVIRKPKLSDLAKFKRWRGTR
jgi:hypothetical protein